MTEYIATFYTHFSAMRSFQALTAAGIAARLAPVPRALSASCGSCVRYMAGDPCVACLHADYERVVVMHDNAYETVVKNNAAV